MLSVASAIFKRFYIGQDKTFDSVYAWNVTLQINHITSRWTFPLLPQGAVQWQSENLGKQNLGKVMEWRPLKNRNALNLHDSDDGSLRYFSEVPFFEAIFDCHDGIQISFSYSKKILYIGFKYFIRPWSRPRKKKRERERETVTQSWHIVNVRSCVRFFRLTISTDDETRVKLTGRWPIFDITGAMHHRIILAVPCRWSQGVPLLHTMQPVCRCHVACGLQIPDFHAADKASSWTHAESHWGCNRKSDHFIPWTYFFQVPKIS